MRMRWSIAFPQKTWQGPRPWHVGRHVLRVSEWLVRWVRRSMFVSADDMYVAVFARGAFWCGHRWGECGWAQWQYLVSAAGGEGNLIWYLQVSPFHKYATLIFITPHTLSFWKEITEDSLFSFHHIFQLGSPLLQIISFLLPEALQQSSSRGFGDLLNLRLRNKWK